PYRQRCRLRVMPWAHRRNAADAKGGFAFHAVVPGLPSRSTKVFATARESLRPGLAAEGSATPGRGTGARLPHRHRPHDGLFAMSSIRLEQAAALARRRLGDAQGRRFWRALEALADDPGFKRELGEALP